MDVLFEETDWLCFAFFIRKLQVMDVLFEETGWIFSPGTSGLREIAGDGRVLIEETEL